MCSGCLYLIVQSQFSKFRNIKKITYTKQEIKIKIKVKIIEFHLPLCKAFSAVSISSKILCLLLAGMGAVGPKLI